MLASDGRLALSTLENESFDLVLMDVQMPEMDGLEATIAIRENERGTDTHIPIIAMTAHAMKGDRERCLEAGMDGYVSKPIKIAELLEAIESAVPPSAGVMVSTAESADDLIDRAEVMERVDGDLELLAELTELFLDDCPRLLSEIQDSIARSDSEALERSAHTLKGSIGNFAAVSAAEAAFKLEKMGHDANLNHIEEAYAVLEKEIQRLKPVLADLGKSGNA